MSDPCATRAPIPEGYFVMKVPDHPGWSVVQGRSVLADGFKSENQGRTWLDGFITGKETQ